MKMQDLYATFSFLAFSTILATPAVAQQSAPKWISMNWALSRLP
jgi:hypothetical protein